MYWIDTHCHLASDACRDNPEEYLERARENNVGRILAISCSIDDLDFHLSLKEKYDFIDVAFGMYPYDALELDDKDWDKVYERLHDDRILAVGEIGLDYYWDKSKKDEQIQNFIKQINWANELDKPILIHARDAYQDVYKILKEYPVKEGALMHCYSGSYEMTVQYRTLSTGVLFAFGGALTYKNSRNAKECASKLPLEYIVTETDSPYMTPQIYRGQKNETKNVRYVGEYLAELRGVSNEDIQEAIMANYERFFKVKL